MKDDKEGLSFGGKMVTAVKGDLVRRGERCVVEIERGEGGERRPGDVVAETTGG